jgi:dihydroorotate dehydrogenase electron transfer subunit
MKQARTVKLKEKRWLSPYTFSMGFYVPGINPDPGQFFQVRVDETFDPFLNRPISVASYSKNRLLLVIKVKGKGTKLLSMKEPGDEVTLLGPFGKSLRLHKGKKLLIAGGIGVAPLFFLAQHLYKRRIQFTFVYGVKTPEEMILKANIVRIAHESIFVTERGQKKRMTAVSAIQHLDHDEYDAAYTCGPREMLIDLQKMQMPIPVYAFCEEFLGCGCGLCLGCAIKFRGEYKRICTDGPVFELKEIDFDV